VKDATKADSKPPNNPKKNSAKETKEPAKPKKDASSPVKPKKEPKDKTTVSDLNTLPRKKINKRLKKLQLEGAGPNSAASMRDPISFDMTD
jgi:hypothetical protein